MPTYKFIDLFAGLGGFHLALEQLGCKCVFASELQQDLRTLYHMIFYVVVFHVNHFHKQENNKGFRMRKKGATCLIK